jgi:hypothetical protein
VDLEIAARASVRASRMLSAEILVYFLARSAVEGRQAATA